LCAKIKKVKPKAIKAGRALNKKKDLPCNTVSPIHSGNGDTSRKYFVVKRISLFVVKWYTIQDPSIKPLYRP
jgi:hypothetical protein